MLGLCVMWWTLHQMVAMLGNSLADLGTTLGATSLDGDLARLFLVTLLGLLGIGICWALLLFAARLVMGRLHGAHESAPGSPPPVGDLRARGLAFADHGREEPSLA